MIFLLDENVAKCCARSDLYAAQRTVEVRGLGRGAPDADILRFAAFSGFILVTKDGDDFEALMRQGGPSVPLVVLPGGTLAAEQRNLLERAAPLIERILEAEPHKRFTFAENKLVAYD